MSKKISETPTRTSEPINIRKITGKDVMSEMPIPNDKPTDLYTVYGIVKGFVLGESTFGDFIKFKGDFAAVRVADGQEYNSPMLILQVPLDQVIANQFDSAVAMAGDGAKGVQIEMAVMVSVKPSKTPTGYEWVMRNLIPMAPNNVLLGIKERAMLALEHKK